MHITAAALTAIVFTLMVPAVLSAEQPAGTEPDEPVAAAPAIAGLVESLRTNLHDVSRGVMFSGFFDFNASARRSGIETPAFGSFELGVARPLGTRVELTGAVVASEEGAELTTAQLAVRLSPARANAEDSAALRLHLGRFDVPFGSDWQNYASKDRTEISAPLTTSTILDGGLNATGIQLAGTTRGVDYSAFTLRNDDHALAGGRLGISSRGLTAGVSLMRQRSLSSGANDEVTGFDAGAHIGRLHVRAERVERKPRSCCDSRVSGWHATAGVTLTNGSHATWTPFVRYDAVRTAAADSFAPVADGENRVTAGVNTTLAQLFTFKLEYQKNLAAGLLDENGSRADDAWLAQLVVSF